MKNLIQESLQVCISFGVKKIDLIIKKINKKILKINIKGEKILLKYFIMIYIFLTYIKLIHLIEVEYN